MWQAIVTRFIGPTDTKGARVKAKSAGGTVIVPWNHGMGVDENHLAAAVKLCKKLGWNGTLHGGALPDDSGNAYVFQTSAGTEV